MLDQLGYKKGADGIRVAPATTGKYAQPAHPMQYQVMVPGSLDFNGSREFSIVAGRLVEAGIKVTQQAGGDSAQAYAIETGDNCNAAKSTGYDKFDIALWDWFSYTDPDFQLSVATQGPVVLLERHRLRQPVLRPDVQAVRAPRPGMPSAWRWCRRWTSCSPTSGSTRSW